MSDEPPIPTRTTVSSPAPVVTGPRLLEGPSSSNQLVRVSSPTISTHSPVFVGNRYASLAEIDEF